VTGRWRIEVRHEAVPVWIEPVVIVSQPSQLRMSPH